MDIILIEDVQKLGHKDDIVKVKDGYAKNCLIPKKLAVPATLGELKSREARMAKMKMNMDMIRAKADEVAEKLKATEVVIKKKTGGKEKLFGSVTSGEIAEAIKKLTSMNIDRKVIEIAEHIKTVGEHKVVIKLTSDVKPEITVKVEAE